LKVVTLISQFYQGKFKLPSETQELAAFVQAWTTMLADLSYREVSDAIAKHIMQSEWPPTIADIRRHCAAFANPESQMTALDAWGMILRAVQLGKRASLPPFVADAARSFGWQAIRQSENEDLLRSNFLRFFEAYQAAQQARAQLPLAMRQALATSADREREQRALVPVNFRALIGEKPLPLKPEDAVISR